MSRATSPALAAIAVLLGACTATAPSSSTQPSRDAASGSAAADAPETAGEVCVGVDAQGLDIDEPARSYGLAWNETDDDARSALITEIWTENGTWAEPSLPDRIAGPRAVTDRIGDFHDGRPGEYFEWETADLPEMHHDRLRMPWRLCDPAGATLLEGTDFAVLTPDGRIADLTSFHPDE
jgi:hypothetical protein